MAENLGANFSIDISNLKKGLREANQLIRESESEFKASAASMDDWSKSEAGLNSKIKSLNDVIALQEKKVNALTDNYEKLIADGLDPSSTEASKLRTQINKEKEALEKNRTELKNTTTQLDKFGKEADDTSGDLKGLKTKTDDVNTGWTVMKGALSGLVKEGIDKAIQGFQDLAKFAVQSFEEVDEGYDALIKATGATGMSANELQNSYKKVSKSVKGDFETIGGALGEVNTRFGFTGTQLEDATIQFMKFGEVTGTDAVEAVKQVSRAMENAGIDSSKLSQVLDILTKASQKSGVTVSDVTSAMVKYGAQTRTLGLDTDSTIAILAQFEKAGVNTETVFQGLKTAVKNWTTQGKDARVEFEKITDEIKAAPTDIEAAQIAYETFGKKAGTELSEVIRQGKFDYSDFVKEIKDSKGTVTDTYNELIDGMDKLDLAVQGIKVEASDLAKPFVDAFGEAAESGQVLLTVLNALGGIPEVIEGAFSGIGEFFSGVWDTITDGAVLAFQGLKTAWDGVTGYFKEVGDTIIEGAEDTVNGFIDALNYLPGVDIDNVDWTGRRADASEKLQKQLGDFLLEPMKAINTARTAYLTDTQPKTSINSQYDYEEYKKKQQAITINQTNYYSAQKSRYELYQSEQDTLKALKLATSR